MASQHTSKLIYYIHSSVSTTAVLHTAVLPTAFHFIHITSHYITPLLLLLNRLLHHTTTTPYIAYCTALLHYPTPLLRRLLHSLLHCLLHHTTTLHHTTPYIAYYTAIPDPITTSLTTSYTIIPLYSLLPHTTTSQYTAYCLLCRNTPILHRILPSTSQYTDTTPPTAFYVAIHRYYAAYCLLRRNTPILRRLLPSTSQYTDTTPTTAFYVAANKI